jgi:hypothetical protein
MLPPSRIVHTTLLALALAVAPACSGDSGNKTTDSGGEGVGGGGGENGGGENGGGSGDDGGPPMVISGTLRVQLYRDGANGDAEFMTWEDSGYGETFPFGAYFVGAISERTDIPGKYRYIGTTAVFDNAPEGSEYTIEVDQEEDISGTFRLFAATDQWGDEIIHSSDPIGLHPEEFPLNPGAEVTGMDITVLVPWVDLGGVTAEEAAGETGGSARDCTDGITVSGPVDLTLGGPSANGIVFFENMEKVGPLDWTWWEAEEDADGNLRSSYELQTCANQGPMRLMGAHDSNYNGLIDPEDLLGTYAPSLDTNGNPVTIASDNLQDMRVQIPIFEVESGVSIVPFVSLSGNLGVGGGTFDDLPPGTEVVVAALKRRPQGAVPLETIEGQVYDIDRYEWPDVQGETSVPYDLTVPSNTLMYLWAFADTDGNGTINEAGEPIASGGLDDNGRVQTDTTSQSEDLFLGFAPTR